MLEFLFYGILGTTKTKQQWQEQCHYFVPSSPPSITKNAFTMLCPSPTSKIFSKRTSHSTHYESKEPQLCVVHVFDANRSVKTLQIVQQKSMQMNIPLRVITTPQPSHSIY
jgi:hypothetical protein